MPDIERSHNQGKENTMRRDPIHVDDLLVPVVGAEDITADPMSAQLLGRRLADGELTADEMRDILAGKHNAPPASRHPFYYPEPR